MATWAYPNNHRFKDRYRWLALQKRGITVTVEKRLVVDGDKCIHYGAQHSLSLASVIRFDVDKCVT